jgi:hypothetical protein
MGKICDPDKKGSLLELKLKGFEEGIIDRVGCGGKLRRGLLPRLVRGWRVGSCKMTSPIFVAFGSRSCVRDRSLHSLQWWAGFHLIRSLNLQTENVEGPYSKK